jgi:biopolymer transport protein ExbB
MSTTRAIFLTLLSFASFLRADDAASTVPWWDQAWSARKPIDIVIGGDSPAKEPVAGALVAVRLHEGNFNFAAAREDGGDLRFLAADNKTVLPHRVEKIDALMNEAIVWVNAGDLKPSSSTRIWLYHGNPEAPTPKPDGLYPAEAMLVLPFSDKGGTPTDATGKDVAITGTPTPAEGALIGGGLRFFGNNGLEIAGSDTNQWSAGQDLTVSFWIKPIVKPGNTVIFHREEGGASFTIGLDGGKPYAEITDAAGSARAAAPDAVADGVWRHLAVTASGGTFRLFVNGVPVAEAAKALPALVGSSWLGGKPSQYPAFAGEVDEFRMLGKAGSPAEFLFQVANQSGTEDGRKLVVVGEQESSDGPEKTSETLEHLMLFGDIAENMMFDGWIAIAICVLMIIVGWTVAVKKLLYLNQVEKANKVFLREWRKLAADLTALDQEEDGVPSLEGERRKLINKSPLYHLYHIGSEEISHRTQKSKRGFDGLSGRSIQAIKASLDSGALKEQHKLNGGLVFLTISIAGGPYVGLLGTVMGVMITFAIIAKSGEVDVNSIAPGIASALLATVAGLIVAIPALFIYSYLASRIKQVMGELQMFIDEFITKMAEFYKEAK